VQDTANGKISHSLVSSCLCLICESAVWAEQDKIASQELENRPNLFPRWRKLLSRMTEPEFRNAFHCHRDVLYRFAYRMTGSGSAAEDMVQECFLVLWRKPQAYDPNQGTMRSFLLGIARNLALNRWRDEHRDEPLDDEFLFCLPIDLAQKERTESVARAVQMLPPLQREALILAEYEEMSLEEIAAATEAELAAVKSRLHRARENLRRMLAPLLEKKGGVYGAK
jgi:RNA polymerase sigma-70 factor (ECF subfamily)